jgi:hypothetical protein
LATRIILANFDLVHGGMAVGTFAHFSILAYLPTFHHSQKRDSMWERYNERQWLTWGNSLKKQLRTNYLQLITNYQRLYP